MNRRGMIATVAALLLATSGGAGVVSAPTALAEEAPSGRTPPRLSFIDGEVSFWRPGAEDWTVARVNTPLAPGDALYTGARANLELQIGARAFLRAGEDTQLGLENQEPDFLQFKVTVGHVSLDLRALPAGHTVELNAPNAAITIERTGYYRLDVDSDTTTLITRRGGRATVTPAGGEYASITPSEQVVVEGIDQPTLESYVAPDLDEWDRWNYERTDQMIDAVSARYVSSGVYGLDALDHYGTWRVVPSYGAVWVPDGVAGGWAPYSRGSWVWDPFYGWTWVDDAPWGWAPYHYGRWVYTSGYWGWAPGPVVVTPFYAPAMVAFYGGSHWGVSVGFGGPIGWTALGWGEPLIPWWGAPGFVGRPCWAGWGGPRVVNHVVIKHTTIVHVQDIKGFENAGVHHGLVAVDRDHFGRGPVGHARLKDVDVARFRPVHDPLPIKPERASLAPAVGKAARPPETVMRRPVVATRPPHDPSATLRAVGEKAAPGITSVPPRLVPAPQKAAVEEPRRPAFGRREAPERARPQPPRGFEATTPPGGQAPVGAPERAPVERGPVEHAPRPGVRSEPPAAPGERGPAGVERAPVERAPVERAPRPVARPEAPAAPAPPVSRERGPTGVERAPVERPPAGGASRPVVPPAAPAAPAPPVSRERGPTGVERVPVERPSVERVPRPAVRPEAPAAPAPPPVSRQPGSARVERAPVERPPVERAPRPVARPEPPAAPAAVSRPEVSRPPSRELPGEPANRLFPGRPEMQWPRRESPPAVVQPPAVGHPSQPAPQSMPRHERIQPAPHRQGR